MLIELVVVSCLVWFSLSWLSTDKNVDNRPKTVVVTGAASGLGKATVLELISKGDTVVGLDMNSDALRELSNQLKDVAGSTSSGSNSTDTGLARFKSFQVDVTDSKACVECARLVKEWLSKNGGVGVDAIINFAGVSIAGPLLEMAPSQFQKLFAVNLFGTFNINQAFYLLLNFNSQINNNTAKERFIPRIINIASEVSYSKLESAFTPYTYSKMAVDSYTTSLRQELTFVDDSYFAYVVIVNPGPFRTPLLNSAANPLILHHLKSHPDTKYKEVLGPAELVSREYEDKFAGKPEALGKVLCEIVHVNKPRRRYLVNVGLQARLIKWIPQGLLETGMALALKKFGAPRIYWKKQS